MNTSTRKENLGFVAKLLRLDNAIKLGNYEVVRFDQLPKPTCFFSYDRRQAENLLFISSMFHQSHAWQDSENEEECNAWAIHMKEIDTARTQLKYGAPCPQLLELISADLDFYADSIVAHSENERTCKNLVSHCNQLSRFLSDAEN